MRMITIKEVAEQFGVSHGVVRGLVMSGKIRAVRVGPRLFRFTQQSVDDYIADNTVTSQEDILRSVLSEEAAQEVLGDNVARRANRDGSNA